MTIHYFLEIACVAAEAWLSHLLLSSMLPEKELGIASGIFVGGASAVCTYFYG